MADVCGLFGFVGTAPDVAFLGSLGVEAARRGPHSWGVVLVDESTRAWRHRELGAFTARGWKGIEARAARSSIVIGHARLATRGAPRDVENSQPMEYRDAQVAHNGNVYAHRELVALYGFDGALKTECDSESIAVLAYERGVDVAIGAIGAVPFALLAHVRGEFVAACNAQPLFFLDRPEGRYYCSMPFDGAEKVTNMQRQRKPATPTNGEPIAPETIQRARPEHPIANVRWVDPSTLHANDYNPNHVFGPERELLKLSILEDGWTMPIVARTDGEIVDGFHRWTLASTDAEICEKCGPLVPVVFIGSGKSKADQMVATVRHNRARGQHGILKMSDIVQSLVAQGLGPDEVAKRLGMEREEFNRLIDTRGIAKIHGKDSFGRGWVPVPKSEVPGWTPAAERGRKKAAPEKFAREDTDDEGGFDDVDLNEEDDNG